MTKRKIKLPSFNEHMGFSAPMQKRSKSITKQSVKLKPNPQNVNLVVQLLNQLGLGGLLGGQTNSAPSNPNALPRPTIPTATNVFETDTPQPTGTPLPTSTPYNLVSSPTPREDGGNNPTMTSTALPYTPGIEPTPGTQEQDIQLRGVIDYGKFPASLDDGMSESKLNPTIGPSKEFQSQNNLILNPPNATGTYTPTATWNAETAVGGNPRIQATNTAEAEQRGTVEATRRAGLTGAGTPTVTASVTPVNDLINASPETLNYINTLASDYNRMIPFLYNQGSPDKPSAPTSQALVSGDSDFAANQILLQSFGPNNKAVQAQMGGYGMNADRALQLGDLAQEIKLTAQENYKLNYDKAQSLRQEQINMINQNPNTNLLGIPAYRDNVQQQYQIVGNLEKLRSVFQNTNKYIAARDNVGYIQGLKDKAGTKTAQQATQVAGSATAAARNATRTPTTTRTPTATPTSTTIPTNTPVTVRKIPTATASPTPTLESAKLQPTFTPVSSFPKIPAQFEGFAPPSVQSARENLGYAMVAARNYGPAAAAAAAGANRLPANFSSDNASGQGSGILDAITSMLAPQVASAAEKTNPQATLQNNAAAQVMAGGGSGAMAGAVAGNTEAQRKRAEAEAWKAKTEAALRAQAQARANLAANTRTQEQEAASNQAASNTTNAGYSGAAAGAAAGAYGTGGGGGSSSGSGSSSSGGGGGSSSGKSGSQPSFNIYNNPVTGLNLPQLKPPPAKQYSGAGMGAKVARMPSSNKKGKLKKDIGTGAGLTAHATQPVKESPMPKITTRYGGYKYPNKNSAFSSSNKYGEKLNLQQSIRKQMVPVNSKQTISMLNSHQQMPNVMQYPPSRAPQNVIPVFPSVEQKLSNNNPPYNTNLPMKNTFQKLLGNENVNQNVTTKTDVHIPQYLRRKK